MLLVLCGSPLLCLSFPLSVLCPLSTKPAVGQCYVVGQLLLLPLTLITTAPGKPFVC